MTQAEKRTMTEASVTTSSNTEVLSTSATAPKTKTYKVYSVEDATELCAKKGAKDMDACVAYKTGKAKAKAPKS